MILPDPTLDQGVSAMQEALLLESKLIPSANIVQWIWQLPFAVDAQVVEHTCLQLIQRHSLLRSRFLWRNDRCVRLDNNIQDTCFSLHYDADFATTMDEAQSLLESYLAQDRYAGFDTEAAPLFRCHLLAIDSEQCIIVFTFHQAIIDNQSFTVFIDDFIRLHDDIDKAVANALPIAAATLLQPSFQLLPPVKVAPLQQTASADSHWRELLKGFNEPSLPTLITVSSDTANLTKQSHVVSPLSEIIKQQLLDIASSCNVNLDIVIQAAWAILLQRYCDSDDIAFGVTADTRDDNIPANVIGMFDNTLPVRVKMNSALTLAELLGDLHRQQGQFIHTPLTQIHTLSEVPAGERLMATAVNVEYDIVSDVLSCHAKKWSQGQLHWVYESTFALSGHIFYGETVFVRIDFDVDQYDSAAAEQILRHFTNILGAMVNPSVTVYQLDMLDAVDIEQLKSCAGSAEQAQGQCVHIDIIKHAQQFPDDLAVRIAGQHLSYGELNTRSHLLARYLVQEGVGAGVIVGIGMPRSMDFIVAILAVLRAGGAYLPLESEDPTERLISVLEDAKVSILLTQSTVAKPLLAAVRSANIIPVLIDHWQPNATIKQYAETNNQDPEIPFSNAAYIIYTSGTTGKPKGVVVEHQQLAHHCQTMGSVIACQQGTQVLQFASCAFDVSVEEIFTTLTRGGCLVLREPSMLASTKSFFAALSDNHIAIANLPTAFWSTLVDAASQNTLSWPQCLHTLIVGGEQITRVTYEQFREQNTEHIRFINGYGPTETTITSTYAELMPQHKDKQQRDFLNHRNALPIGRPIKGASHYILDNYLRLCPPRVAGHLYIGGAGVARGYLHREQLTAERFQLLSLDQDLPATRYYATGDRVCNDGDYWYFIGRIDHQIKIRGYRVELGEIESVLTTQAHVKTALVELNPLRPETLVAFVESSKKSALLLKQLQQHLPSCLPHYMVPATIIVLEQFPLTKSGKLDRHQLKLILETDAQAHTDVAVQEPMTERQMALVEIWKTLLDAPQLSLTDSFFELGGHSLLAVKMFSEVERTMGVTMPVKGFFSDPTLQRLDDMITEVLASAGEANQPLSRPEVESVEQVGSLHALQEGGDGCPLYCICGVELYQNLANMLGEQQPSYGIFLPVEEQMVASFSESGKLYTLPSVEVMAAAYVTVIREHQPFGPYKLAGLSFGGILAYEVAQQLMSDGEKVETLVLLDAFVPLKRDKIGLEQLLAVWKRFRMGQLNYLSRMGKKCVRRLQLWLKANSLKHMASNIANKLDDVDFELFRSLAYRKASAEYGQHIQPYRGDVIVIHAQDGHAEAEGVNTADHGWGELVLGKTQVLTIPGDHTGILRPPNVAVLAEKIQIHITTTEYRQHCPHSAAVANLAHQGSHH